MNNYEKIKRRFKRRRNDFRKCMIEEALTSLGNPTNDEINSDVKYFKYSDEIRSHVAQFPPTTQSCPKITATERISRSEFEINNTNCL